MNRPSGACATSFSKPVQFESNSLIPIIGGDRKYLGSYLRGDPQNTSRPHDVVPNTKYAVSGQPAPRTAPPVMPGTHDGLLQSGGWAVAVGTWTDPAANTAAIAATLDRTNPLSQEVSPGPPTIPLSGRLPDTPSSAALASSGNCDVSRSG